MEAKGGGGELRKLHIVYFLSRNGGVDHPHLVRVHHLSRNGVTLRDIKRWLGEMRGKHMPESFSWSYKRKYRRGYVWQDLQDDDLIIPISDDEYILKGSEISINPPTLITTEFLKLNIENQQSYVGEQNFMSKYEHHGTSSNPVPKYWSEIAEAPTFGSESSSFTDDLTLSAIKERKLENRLSWGKKLEASMSKVKREVDKVRTDAKISELVASSRHDSSKNKNFRNIMRCRLVDTSNSVVVASSKQRSRAFYSMCSGSGESAHSTETRVLDRKLEATYRIYGTSWNDHPQRGRVHGRFNGVDYSRKNENKARHQSAAYKPVRRPSCSQCGKPFKPEKLHAHMKYCKGKKMLARSGISAAAATVEKAEQRSFTESQHDSLVSGYFLTH